MRPVNLSMFCSGVNWKFIAYLGIVYINWEFDLQELLILLPLNFIVKLNVSSCSADSSLKTYRCFNPAVFTDLRLDENTRLQRSGLKDFNVAGGEFFACLEVKNFDLQHVSADSGPGMYSRFLTSHACQ
jgi:hypothetical protein